MVRRGTRNEVGGTRRGTRQGERVAPTRAGTSCLSPRAPSLALLVFVDAHGEPVERRRDAARQLGLEVGVEVLVRQVREVCALRAHALRDADGFGDAQVR